MSLTTDPKDPRLIEGQKNETGQHEIYLVLSEEERAKGFVRPVRRSYVHVGRYHNYAGIDRMLTEDEQQEMMKEYPHPLPYVAVLGINGSDGKHLGGSYVTQKEFDAWKAGKRIGGCGTVTTMGTALAETYARNPKFYGATYCTGCGKHLPVNEFLWDGTNEEVGSLGPEIVFDDKGNIKGAKTYDSPAVISDTKKDLVIEIPPDDEIDDDGKLINEPSIDEKPIPKTLAEAIGVLLTPENIKFASDKSEDEFLGQAYHGFGTGIRNGWGLWSGSDLSKWFNERGIYHADDMSGIILRSAYRISNNKDINLEKQIKVYRKYWDKYDPNVNKGIM